MEWTTPVKPVTALGEGWRCSPVYIETTCLIETPTRFHRPCGRCAHASRCDFEASTTELGGADTDRRGLEALAITQYRAESGGSPTVKFGRMRSGYRSSSGNNSRLVARGNRFRGRPDSETPASPLSVPVHEDLSGDVIGETWMGWSWSPWTTTAQAHLRTSDRLVPSAIRRRFRSSLCRPRPNRPSSHGASCEGIDPRPPPSRSLHRCD
jgi:hypothetical protein